MSSATIGDPGGFNFENLWIPSLSGATNVKFAGETGRTGNGIIGDETVTYSTLSFEANGYVYEYRGEWQVQYDRGLLVGSVSAAGYYDSIKVSSGAQTIATYSGNAFEVDFGTQGNIPLISLLLNVLGLLIDGSQSGSGAYENLNTNATPNIEEIAFSGSDTIRGGIGDDTISGGAGHDRIFGGAGGDTLSGGAGNDRIDGEAGNDIMSGGLGNDTFVVDSQSDVVIEAVGGGTDTVLTKASFTLAAGQEIENLRAFDPSGTAAMNLTGNAFANSLRGNAGDNVLDGGAGADVMIGLGGNDTYWVDSMNDRVFESVGGGNDTIWATTSYILRAGQEVETLRLAPSTTTQPLSLRGNAFDNALYGNNGNNVLDGRGGQDQLFGFAGDDRITVHESGSTVDGGTGFDTVLVGGIDQVAFGAGDVKSVERFVVSQDAVLDLSALTTRTGEIITRATVGHEATVIGTQTADRILASQGDADITGGAGNDVFYASTRQTTLHFNEAGFGKDTLYRGGAGDLVLDFAGVADDMSDLTFKAVNGGKDVQITAAGAAVGDVLTVKGMTIAQLTAHAEFTFV